MKPITLKLIPDSKTDNILGYKEIILLGRRQWRSHTAHYPAQKGVDVAIRDTVPHEQTSWDYMWTAICDGTLQNIVDDDLFYSTDAYKVTL